MIVLSRAELVDVPLSWPVVDSTVLVTGRITEFVEDEVRAPDGTVIKREYVKHPGAVAVIALDDAERVVLVRQYRHAVRHRLIEPPAGLLDVEGENYLVGVQRELAEEVHLAAAALGRPGRHLLHPRRARGVHPDLPGPGSVGRDRARRLRPRG